MKTDTDKRENLAFFVRRNIEQLVYTQNLSELSPVFPVRLYIEPTNACNLRCIHCHHNNIKEDVFKRRPGLMDFDVFKKIIDEIKGRHCEISLNAQGEPLLHKDIIEMVRYCKRNGVFVSVLTNATLLTEEISKELVLSRLDRIVFSFDSIKKAEYEAIRVNGSFDPTLLNILKFIRINEDSGHNTFVCCSVVVQNTNRESIEDYDRYFYSLPVDNIFHSQLLNLSGNSGVAGEVDMKGKKKVFGKKDFPICRVPWEMMTVNWDGEVTACGLDFNVLYPVGSIKDSTLTELWNSKKMRAFRRSHLENDFAPIEKAGHLCGRCNCRHDDEYDIRNYRLFTERDLLRKFDQYSTGDASQKRRPDMRRYKKLSEEIERLAGHA